ncbi:MAG TPA: aminoglycoside phosphotransferase family protein [Cytophagales bacterium]|jgi:Ser/Thr protein kinase RdoA (MazF antagonist)|nr:aminoglycoside phosphotransferase family protein [Cytophagales bacterium]
MTEVLDAFGVTGKIEPIGSGHIHKTFKISGQQNFVLQRVNKNVFTKPEIIATNNRVASLYLRNHHPEYLFPQTLLDKNGNDLYYDSEGFPWRLFSLIENSFTIDEVHSEEDAFAAAQGFGLLTKNLNGIDVSLFNESLERFHDLSWRYEQFENALSHAQPEVIQKAKGEIEAAHSFKHLVDEYQQLIASGQLILRITHNDTKVNNILFDSLTRKVICAIDLDTLMPGYFIYDLGDMVRTFVSPVNEEEKDVSKIQFRKNIYDALLKGYLAPMESILTSDEKKSIPFAGQMMTYIMALRMLADFLRGNTYYHITYPEQNLVRARNQFHLLELICKNCA